MCRVPLYTPQYDAGWDPLGAVGQSPPFDGSLSDVGFESDLELFDGPASYSMGGPPVKQEDICSFLTAKPPLEPIGGDSSRSLRSVKGEAVGTRVYRWLSFYWICHCR